MNEIFENIMGISDAVEPEAEFIPLLTSEDEEQMRTQDYPTELPILPIRNTVLFPGVVLPITVARDKSIKLIQEAHKSNKTIGVIAQRKHDVEEPEMGDLYAVGTIATVMRLLKMPDGSTTAIIQGKKRFKLEKILATEPYMKAQITPLLDIPPIPKEKNVEALLSSIRDMAMNIIKLSPNIPSEAGFALRNIESPTFLVNFISSNMNAGVEEKQRILDIGDFNEKAHVVLQHLSKELQMLELKNDIQSKVKVDIDKQQREFYLHQQIKQIQEELGENPVEQQVNELKAKAVGKKWPEKAEKTFNKELDKLARLNPSSPEFSVQYNYLDTLVELPWNHYSVDDFNLKNAQKILDRDHFGLEKVKERIVEFLAVLKLKGDMKSPILCLYGPPGVGKTSLGKSIAEALGRKYVRMSLGGLHDEAEIRGHRRTYIGAMPGRVITNIKKAGTSNPVFVLDEIDKLGTGPHGDPSSALLEVLDPEQNANFNDNYIEVDYDLSRSLFVATANSLSTVQPALRDRMEIIEVNGYTVEEKVEIAKRHLIPKQLLEHGMNKKQFELNDKQLEKLITDYTNESGVRGLEKIITKLIRNKAKEIAFDRKPGAKFKDGEFAVIIGPAHSKEKYENNDYAGVVTGLAWTSVGGEILFIETSLSKGKGKLTLTGNLGEVMKESAIIAHEFIRSHAGQLGLTEDVFEKWDVHVHIPEGATPKDGPSAGITMLTALASAYTQRKVRKSLAMTGELTLRGKVLPVGGIKEKILAAKRANIKEIILCNENKPQIDEIEPRYVKGLKFHYVSDMKEVLEIALLREKVKNAKTIS
ncbi:MAG TPA: endopeptidase La [Flavobacteriales bacterium]|nr:endopeptidase La [Flavobacteriales bacterium]